MHQGSAIFLHQNKVHAKLVPPEHTITCYLSISLWFEIKRGHMVRENYVINTRVTISRSSTPSCITRKHASEFCLIFQQNIGHAKLVPPEHTITCYLSILLWYEMKLGPMVRENYVLKTKFPIDYKLANMNVTTREQKMLKIRINTYSRLMHAVLCQKKKMETTYLYFLFPASLLSQRN